MELPKAFEARMRRLLGEDADRLFAALSEPDSVHAMLVNREKLPDASVLMTDGLAGDPVPYAPGAFYCGGDLGATALHRAGAFYLQDPAAMAPVSALPLTRGMRVLDLCAAPGGKTAQLAMGVGEEGLVVSGELNPARAKVLSANTERLGLKSSLVINADAAYVASLFPGWFDCVLADAPCSGEGMFRKNPEALRMWSEAAVAASAARQAPILEAAAGAVRPGGLLLYSTCTFSLEENEELVSGFLGAHPEFSPVPVPDALWAATAPGVTFEGTVDPRVSLGRRFYPHLSPGEGQFLILLRKRETGKPGGPAFRDATETPDRSEAAEAGAFLRDVLEEGPLPELRRWRDTLALIPEEMPVPAHCVLSAGVTLGSFRKGRLVPAHRFFSAYGRRFRRRLDLQEGDPRLESYLHGEEIPAPGLEDGWAVVTVSGCPLGGIKVSRGVAKNHYPKGLRT